MPPLPPAAAPFLSSGNVGNDGFGGDHQRRDGAGISQGGAHDLGRIDHTGLDQIFVPSCQGVVAEMRVLRVVDLSQNDGAFFAGVLSDLA